MHNRLLIKSLEHDEGRRRFAVEAVDCLSLAPAVGMALNCAEEELTMAESTRGGVKNGPDTVLQIRGVLVNCGQDCFRTFNGCLPRGSLLI